MADSFWKLLLLSLGFIHRLFFFFQVNWPEYFSDNSIKTWRGLRRENSSKDFFFLLVVSFWIIFRKRVKANPSKVQMLIELHSAKLDLIKLLGKQEKDHPRCTHAQETAQSKQPSRHKGCVSFKRENGRWKKRCRPGNQTTLCHKGRLL